MNKNKRLLLSGLFLVILTSSTSCKVFKPQKCDRCPEFTEVQQENDSLCME